MRIGGQDGILIFGGLEKCQYENVGGWVLSSTPLFKLERNWFKIKTSCKQVVPLAALRPLPVKLDFNAYIRPRRKNCRYYYVGIRQGEKDDPIMQLQARHAGQDVWSWDEGS